MCKEFDKKLYEARISKLVGEIETARWALFEIRRDSETGRILKQIMLLISEHNHQNVPDINQISFRLSRAGYSEDLVKSTVARLFKPNITH